MPGYPSRGRHDGSADDAHDDRAAAIAVVICDRDTIMDRRFQRSHGFRAEHNTPRQGGISPVGDLGEAVTSDRPERQRCDVVTVDLERGKDGVCRRGRGGVGRKLFDSPVCGIAYRQNVPTPTLQSRCDDEVRQLVANMMAAATAATTTVIVASAARTGTRRVRAANRAPSLPQRPRIRVRRPSRLHDRAAKTFPLDTRVLLSGRAEAETAARQGHGHGPCRAG